MMTGLRVNEVRQLEWRDLYLEEPRPYIKLRAESTKSKRSEEIVLHHDLV